ncbi:nucleotidyltransferase domain-containing protein [Actinomadura macrotermitis]|uniref:Polymerase nucleotidyl transferase domain-containing protein n=1 Tax=Actinomadura macrotermitis TaxID=2585200 RepID=A0A7K0BVE0_9ACTN|nr:nucleotidyltransferase domain-containing protein [Actinomadura macrotermitis]MQY05036.1 hypothetical protein [Actinomadura macrotermitis]
MDEPTDEHGPAGGWDRSLLLGEDRVRRLLESALERVTVPDSAAIVLEGSIAEGFGNATSDVDFLVIVPGSREYLTMPTVLFVDDRRVEVRIRSAAQIEAQNERLRAMTRRGARPSATEFEDLLNRAQRLSRAVPLRNRPLVESTRALMPYDEIIAMVRGWYGQFARRAARRAVALAALGRDELAMPWARTSLTYGAKHWAAGRGETYLGIKWTTAQFQRADPPPGMLERHTALTTPGPLALSPADYVKAAVDLLGDLGVTDVSADPGQIYLRRRRDVTTWQIGSRLHVIRRRRQVYAFGDEAERMWRSLSFHHPVPRLLADAPLPRERAGGLLAEFHRLGLIQVCWGGPDGSIIPAPVSAPLPVVRSPLLGIDGLALPPGTQIGLAPLTAERFAAAGMAQAWANVEVENAREDLLGAIKNAQWPVALSSAHRMLRYTAAVLLNAYGTFPHPAVEEAVYHVRELAGPPAELVAGMERLERLFIGDPSWPEHAETRQDELADLVDRVRAHLNTAHSRSFPLSFDSADGWHDTLEIGYDWVRLGAHLDATLPIEEARDLIASGGQQPHVAAEAESAAAGDDRVASGR